MAGFDLTLSFDNGPEPEATPLVLDTLGRRGVHATFFVVGEKLVTPGRRALAERAADKGHWIGNHTWTHSVPLGERREPDIAEREIGRTQDAIGALAHPARFFRPFGRGGRIGPHLLSPPIVHYLECEHYTCVLWNAIPRDWEDADGWAERALAQCRAQSWTLLVLHDLPTGAMRHLDRFLGAAEQAGARFLQEHPPDCVPLRRGERALPLERYVGGRPG
jgi:peptidoglycan/xylan/chitin deacetylase (PgdA/CDA1 family)